MIDFGVKYDFVRLTLNESRFAANKTKSHPITLNYFNYDFLFQEKDGL